MELHVACFVADGCVGVCMSIIHEHLGLFVGGLGGLGLQSGDSIDGREHTWVDGACIVEEGAIDGLHVFDAISI